MKKSLWALLLMANGAAFAQTQVNEYHPGITAEGAVYYLPKTTIQVNVRVEKTTYTPGEFCKYADKYLRLGKVNETGYSTYKIIGTDITSYGEADKDKAFAVKVNPKTAVCNLRLAEDGRLLAVNTDAPKEKALPKPFEPSAKPAPIDPRSFLNQEILAAGRRRRRRPDRQRGTAPRRPLQQALHHTPNTQSRIGSRGASDGGRA